MPEIILKLLKSMVETFLAMVPSAAFIYLDANLSLLGSENTMLANPSWHAMAYTTGFAIAVPASFVASMMYRDLQADRLSAISKRFFLSFLGCAFVCLIIWFGIDYVPHRWMVEIIDIIWRISYIAMLVCLGLSMTGYLVKQIG